jgi:FkbH-like protein
MKLLDALEILRRPVPEDADVTRLTLACGFTPLHLETYLTARAREAQPSRRVEIATGLFDDLLGTLQRTPGTEVAAVATVVEWADIDPRLGARSLGGWRPQDVDDILMSAQMRLALLEGELLRLAGETTVVCCLPTLPLPPMFVPRPDESGSHELQLRQLVSTFGATLASTPGLRLVSGQSLDRASAPAERFDIKSEIAKGFPYTLPHADAVAAALVGLIHPPATKKGIITDLDDTLWAGLLGEVGADGVAWSLDDKAQLHGLYQQLLASLASSGVLVAVASKNDPELVEEAFKRTDLVLRGDAVFPVEASWGPKSEAVARILKTWNIGADAVVFVDDSPMELAEVAAAFGEIECLPFPKGDVAALWDLLERLRATFGKSRTTDEDALRLPSIRANAQRAEAVDPVAFLESLDGKVTFACDTRPDQRAFELINKTNQFNLNGRRLTEPELARYLERPGAFLMTVSYQDRFGPLGKIAALLGTREERKTTIDSWVMSCRSFSRRIEHHTLAYVFETLGAETLELAFEPTARNAVLTEFLATLGDGPLTRERFQAKSPPLVHHVLEETHA